MNAETRLSADRLDAALNPQIDNVPPTRDDLDRHNKPWRDYHKARQAEYEAARFSNTRAFLAVARGRRMKVAR